MYFSEIVKTFHHDRKQERRLIASITKENEYGARHVTRCVGVFRKSLLYPTGKSGNEPR